MSNVLKRYGPHRQKTLVRAGAAFVFCLDHLLPEDVYEEQPLVLADRFVLLFDGRLDNRSELGRLLNLSQRDLALLPDSVIVCRLYERWGERGFERIVGAFAIIIMDLQSGRMLCARDHMGLRVLYYHQSSDWFAVATIPEALFALSWVPRILNKERLADFLTRQPGDDETTYFRHIYRVQPGSVINIDRRNVSKRLFWDPTALSEIRLSNDRDYVEAFRERLDRAVRANLRSSRAPCATITGGLDSSSIAVTAADILAVNGNQLNTFTAIPEPGFFRQELRGRYFDETPYVHQIAKLNSNIVPHYVIQSRDPTPKNVAETIRISGLPGGTLNDLWNFEIYTAARSAGHNVILTGEMGNTTMSYDGCGLFTELLLTFRLIRLFGEVGSSGYRWQRHVRQQVIGPLIPALLFRKYKQWRRSGKPPWHNYAIIRSEFAAEMNVVDRAACGSRPFDMPSSRNWKLQRVQLYQGLHETAEMLAKIRAEFSLDMRLPAYDRRIVEFCIAIPENQYLRNGQDRWLIRRAMQGRLPECVVQQKKTGAQAADWFPRLARTMNEIAEEVNRLADNPEVSSILDMERLKSIIASWPVRQPSEYTAEESRLLAVPDALGSAYFIESLTGRNAVLDPEEHSH